MEIILTEHCSEMHNGVPMESYSLEHTLDHSEVQSIAPYTFREKVVWEDERDGFSIASHDGSVVILRGGARLTVYETPGEIKAMIKP